MFVNELFESNDDDMFATPWRITVANLLIKLIESPARQRSVEIEAEDIDDIKMLVNLLQKNDMDRAKILFDRFSYNELDNALYMYISRLRPDIDLYKLMGVVDDDYLDESEDDEMFAPGNKAIKIYQILKDVARDQLADYIDMVNRPDAEGYDKAFAAARIREIPSIISVANQFKRRGLESGLIEWRELQNYDNDPEFSVTDWMSDVVGESMGVTLDRLYRQVCLQKDINEDDSDDMFASAFQIERDVMVWQRDASRIAGTRGMHSKKVGSHLLLWVQDDEGNVTGVYYSPQPASDDTNIGTWNKRFRGGLDRYMARDPSNPFKNMSLDEDDDMFSDEPRLFQKIGKSIENYADGYLEMGRDVLYSQDESVHEYAKDLITNGKAMLRAGQAFQKGMQAGLMEWVLVNSEVRNDYYTYCQEVEDWDPEKIINDHFNLKEEAAGVGVVKNSKDPRYVMATMGDQNDVTAATLPNMMKAYSLIGKKAKKR